MLKAIRIYIQLRIERIDVTNLETGDCISTKATGVLSGNTVHHFNKAKDMISDALKDLGIRRGFLAPSLKLLLHLPDAGEGGLNASEERPLHNLGELIGGRAVWITEKQGVLSNDEALLVFVQER